MWLIKMRTVFSFHPVEQVIITIFTVLAEFKVA